MPEWSIGAVSKTVVPLREPRVRIPVFPQPKRTKVGFRGQYKAGSPARLPALFVYLPFAARCIFIATFTPIIIA